MWVTPAPYNNGVTPGTASTFAGPVDAILIGMFVASCLVIVLVFLGILGFGIRFRRGSKTDRKLPKSTTWLEISWIIAPFMVFLGFFIWGAYVYQWMFTPPRNAYVVAVDAKQWMWKFQHPDGRLEIDTLHVPLGRPIRLVMTSEDVIHSLAVPAFRIKHDVLPGVYQQMWFEATRTGSYRLYCDQYCGALHARMTGRIIVMNSRDFSRWLAAGKPPEPLARQGKRVFQDFGCAGCHGANSVVHAPKLAGLYGKPVTLVNGKRVIANDQYLQGCILHPYTQYVAGYPPIMPSFQGQLTQAQIMALVAYIRSLGGHTSGGL